MTATLKIADWTTDYYIANRSSCDVVLKDSARLKEIPLLNNAPLHDFKDRQLVRFRGMIQDMHDPEYYFQHYEVRNAQTGTSDVRCGMYTDSARCLPHEEISLESEKNQSSERHTCVVISTPGLNDWAKEKLEQVHNVDINISNSCIYKRSFDGDNCEDMDCSEPMQKKEKILTQDNETMDTSSACDTKASFLSKDHILNFPIPMVDGKACIVKIYEEPSLKLNQVIEVTGFVSLDPLLTRIHDSEDTMSDAEMHTHHPPASLVPRLHAIRVVQLTTHEIENAPELVSRAQSIRSDLHVVLSQLLFGDGLAADYLICHLLSSIYMRKEFLCLGNYPLNITHFPADKYKTFAKDLYKFLTLLVKKSHLLEVTLENLNDLTLLPKKDYECNRLTSGILQLSDNTHLVIDETELTTGQVSQAGRANYTAICDLINFQKVTYDFKYYQMEYETDIPILILSEAKSFIPCQTQVILKIDAESDEFYPQVLEIVTQYLKDECRLANIRQYLEVAREAKFEFNEDILKTIQEDFVHIRQTNKNVSVDHLHALMILARLLSLSHGSNTLTVEYWKKAVQMEMERLDRLPQKK